MSRLSTLVAVCTSLLLTGASVGQTILYVDQNAAGPTHDGWTWCTAFTDLQDAVELAVYDVTIRVADGIYTPDRGTGDRNASFFLTSNVALEGGYAGCGSPDPDERDIDLYETILSGDLNGDDEPGFVNNSENSCHVVRGGGTDATAILDGFSISGGNADGTDGNPNGGGMWSSTTGSPTLVDCFFRSNYAHGDGGGMRNYGDPLLTDCLFVGNVAGQNGGAVYAQHEPTFSRCLFARNSANDSGGAVYIGSSNNLTLADCVFIRNIATAAGGGIQITSHTTAEVNNCTFHINGANIGHAISSGSSNSVNVTNCILWDGGNEVSGSGVTVTYSNVQGGWPGGNIFADPYFVDADGADDIPGTEDDDLRLLSKSRCIDTGDPDFQPEPGETDLDGNPRVVNARVDMGAYEYQSCETDVDCDDGDACTDDSCDPVTGCVHTAVECEAGYVCVDGFCQVVCEVMDADADGDIDLRDYAVWQNCFGGPGN